MKLLCIVFFCLIFFCQNKNSQITEFVYKDVLYSKTKPDNTTTHREGYPHIISIKGESLYPNFNEKPQIIHKKNRNKNGTAFLTSIEKRLKRKEREIDFMKEKLKNEKRILMNIQKRLLTRAAFMENKEKDETKIRKPQVLNKKKEKNSYWPEILIDFISSIFFGITAGLAFFLISFLLEQGTTKETANPCVCNEKKPLLKEEKKKKSLEKEENKTIEQLI